MTQNKNNVSEKIAESEALEWGGASRRGTGDG